MKKLLVKNILYIALIQALAATLGSLYASEVLKYAPCVLCWYQRVMMYPLVLIITVGILKKDKNLPSYVFPLAIIGGVVAFYQYLLQLGIIPESATPCTFGVPCTTRYIDFFGFVTFPLLSFLAFVVIIGSMVIYTKSKTKL
ncbi:MAG: disulfide oxidoreductase [Patescibacteria group bacterium]|nr:disulfide oxidoreductase [Patescibacteria group bacterium]